MSVAFKKILRKTPGDKTGKGKFHPRLVTMGQTVDVYKMAYAMQKRTGLSQAQLQGVLLCFVDIMREMLFNGHAVNIRDFGVFRLGSSSVGSEKEEDCTADKIRSVRILFRASVNVKPMLDATTRTPGEKIDFIDIVEALKKKEKDDGDEAVDPLAK